MKRLIYFLLIVAGLLGLTACRQEAREDIPILLYHSLVEELEDGQDPAMHVSVENFKKDLDYLKSKGYRTIDLKQLEAYYSKELDFKDDKVFMISFDDGYMDNYSLAYPILKEYGFGAVINPIGWSVGRDKHIDSDQKINPHFSWEQAREMLESGLIEFGSHSFDLHNLEGYSYGYKEKTGLGLLSYEGEEPDAYRQRIYRDLKKSKDLMEEELGQEVSSIAYPYGQVNSDVIEVAKDLGFRMGFVIDRDQASPSIFEIRRISIRDDLRVKDIWR